MAKRKSRRSRNAEPPADVEACITSSLVDSIGAIARECRTKAVFVYADALTGERLPMPKELSSSVIYVSKTASETRDLLDRGTRCLRVPNVPYTRLGQVKIAIFLALYRDFIEEGDIVIFVSGLPGSGMLDTLFVTQVGLEREVISSAAEMRQLPSDVQPEVLDRVMDLAAELGSEGREGKPVGALFVLGDTDKVLSLSRQLILNPFRGYPREDRNILDPALEETVKELTTIDGAFLIHGDGLIESCGAFLKTASQEEFELPMGLGARHHAAAAITAVTDSIALTVSESTGTVTVFRGGKVIVTLDKPYRVRQGQRKRS